MNKKDILELKKRFKKDDCSFTRLTGCYVNGDKNIILHLNESFLNLEEDELFKYLEIAKKTLSGTIGNNLLELNFPINEEEIGGRQKSLMILKASQLKDENLLDNFYKTIIDSYDYTGNFLILLFHDAYDVLTKTSDNGKLDESEEVYEYILCAICPVTLSKPALGYLEDQHKIGARNRDWVVGPPDIGFIFPAFTDRSTDIHSVMYYTKNAKDPHPEIMEEVLGCSPKQTAAEKKETFHTIVSKAIADDEEKAEEVFLEIQENLNNIVEETDFIKGTEREPIALTNDTIKEILVETGVPEEVTEKIEKSFVEAFGDTPPAVEELLDSKALQLNEKIKKEKELKKKVEILEAQLERAKEEIALDAENKQALEENKALIESYDVVLQVKAEKVPQIKSEIIDGKKCLIVPLEENEQANVISIDK
ncbi:DUF4317 domain-containing protein [Caproiciproducens sp. MSJ-32]|uniref:DUF4317 domain-containing protein n=1 Tax=Caproiciproducens sp. MSJ-32 TaxID=2841527 RepID=UPI001C127FCA|nr:DUF4317 domain-containing protein [Caproiciproducens sp. MSJ-32]MBU5454942.1 DUF4317 domain-containing protein [Caproiciproducens sp. MSJ-32]